MDDCDRMVVSDGYCDLHYRRIRRNGTPNARTVEDRFWSYVQVRDSGCWDWVGTRWPSGYGCLRVLGFKATVHRFSYEIHVGPIAEGLVIDHLCRNRACVNPEHLEAVEFRENLMRGNGAAARNARLTHCVRGHSFDPPNGYVRANGHRVCRACQKIRRDAANLRAAQEASAQTR